MTTQEQDQESLPHGLQLWWYEVKEGEEVRTWRGQLYQSMQRLGIVFDELELICNEEDVSVALTRLAYHVENYFIRAYELRERVLGLLASLTGQKKIVDNLRHPTKRQDALASLQPVALPLVKSITEILDLLHKDIGLRNMHTHRIFLNIGLSTGYDIFDPHDALLDLQREPDAQRRLEDRLQDEIQRVSEEYMDKVNALTKLTLTFLKKVDDLIRGQ